MSEQNAGDDLTYAYRRSAFSAPRSFRLADDGLHWDNGRHSGQVAYDAIKRVRLSYRPGNIQAHRFLTEIWSQGAPKLSLVSTSWKSATETSRLDADYRNFVLGLHQHLRRVSQPIEMIGGTNPILYWGGILIFTAAALGIAAMTARALQQDAGVAALMIGAFLGLFIWQGGHFFRRNWPTRYSADRVPEELLPKLS